MTWAGTCSAVPCPRGSSCSPSRGTTRLPSEVSRRWIADSSSSPISACWPRRPRTAAGTSSCSPCARDRRWRASPWMSSARTASRCSRESPMPKGTCGSRASDRSSGSAHRCCTPPTAARTSRSSRSIARTGTSTCRDSTWAANRADRDLDLSRFDVGGVSNALQADKLSAYLFSDRGVYRPGDTFHVGVIVKPADWTTPLAGIPLEAVVSDARGLEVKRERVRLSPQGFEEVQYTTSDAAPTGTWTVALYIVKDGRAGALLGSVTVQVREFQPDRMTMAAHLSAESADGWVSPDGLTARITLKNLFGTPAAGRRVTARVQLTPGFPTLRGLEDYRFSDPQKAKETYSDELPPATTDGSGEAQFTLGLERFARATYRLRFIAEGYEAEGGRSVTAEAGAAGVSNQPFLVGYKPDGDLRYLHKDSQRAVEFVVVGSDGKQLGVRKLRLARIRVSYVSVLARQFDGTYKYQSVKKEIPVSDAPLAIAATGLTVPLPTAEPGDFALVVRDSAATELSRVEYTVAG